MAAYGDKVQALMDEFYNEWQKEENKGKSKWDILDGFSAAHKISVVLGNFNYQVENGGLSQWISNGYFHDDAEKLIEYLEIGAESEERCQTILKSIYTLDQYSEETDCDRYGNFYEEDGDGDSSFIGDVINCDTFDTWYYEKCGEENWWQVVCGIIDKVEARESELIRKDEHDGEITATATFPLRVYIENAGKPENGGFTMPLPAKPDDIRPFLDKIEIGSPQDIQIREIRSDIVGLGEAVTDAIYNSMSPDALSELNYLAAKIDAIQQDEIETFSAALEADRHCGRFSELINLTENLGCLYLQPAFTPEQYGEFLLTMDQDLVSGTIEKIKNSNDPNLHDLVSYLERLEAHVDPESYARSCAAEENGVFTEHGYLTENDDFKEVYRGPEDIPAEYRVSGYHEQQRTEFVNSTIPASIRKVENTDLTALLAKMHVLGGDYAADIRYNLNMLEMRRSSEYLLLMNGRHAFLSEAENAYRRGTDSFDAIMKADEENIDTRIFALHVTDAHREHVVGDLVEVNVRELQRDITNHSISPVRIDATPKFGPDVSYTPEEWDKLEAIDHHMLQSWTRRYDPADSQAVILHLEKSRDIHSQSGSVISSGELLSILNTVCMEVAENPQQNMLLLPISAAKDMLTHGDTSVFRLMPYGAKELSPLDAMPGRGGLWYQNYRECAIKVDDLSGLDKWAKRETETIISKLKPERGPQDKPKSHDPEL